MNRLSRQRGYLYLRTGGNGTCKTLFTLQDVRKLQLATGRPVAWNGRFKLKPEKEAEFGWKRIDFKDWQAEPDGTIFLIDECHNDLPKRSASSTVPEHVRMLAEHRVRGFDFFLLTQHPMNIDDFVRRLVQAPGWHQHLKRIFGGTNATRVLQWDAVNPQCEKDGSGRAAQITTRAQPKEVYSWYESATIHTAKVRIPRAVWVLVASVLLVPALGYYAYQYIKPKAPEAAAAGAAPGQTVPGSSGGERRPMTPGEYVASYRPRLPGLMHTAPAYDKLTEPKRVPMPAACVSMPSKGCKCFTQDATPYPIDEVMCRGLVEHGAFYAFTEPQKLEVASRPQEVVKSAPEAGSGLSVIGALPQVLERAPAPAPAPAPEPPQPQRIASVKR